MHIQYLFGRWRRRLGFLYFLDRYLPIRLKDGPFDLGRMAHPGLAHCLLKVTEGKVVAAQSVVMDKSVADQEDRLPRYDLVECAPSGTHESEPEIESRGKRLATAAAVCASADSRE